MLFTASIAKSQIVNRKQDQESISKQNYGCSFFKNLISSYYGPNVGLLGQDNF